jgi:hypothetical protein
MYKKGVGWIVRLRSDTNSYRPVGVLGCATSSLKNKVLNFHIDESCDRGLSDKVLFGAPPLSPIANSKAIK